jgi:hypothetical protein
MKETRCLLIRSRRQDGVKSKAVVYQFSVILGMLPDYLTARSPRYPNLNYQYCGLVPTEGSSDHPSASGYVVTRRPDFTIKLSIALTTYV